MHKRYRGGGGRAVHKRYRGAKHWAADLFIYFDVSFVWWKNGVSLKVRWCVVGEAFMQRPPRHRLHTWPWLYMTPRLYWALALPWLAAMMYHRAASLSLCTTPYAPPRTRPRHATRTRNAHKRPKKPNEQGTACTRETTEKTPAVVSRGYVQAGKFGMGRIKTLGHSIKTLGHS